MLMDHGYETLFCLQVSGGIFVSRSMKQINLARFLLPVTSKSSHSGLEVASVDDPNDTIRDGLNNSSGWPRVET